MLNDNFVGDTANFTDQCWCTLTWVHITFQVIKDSHKIPACKTCLMYMIIYKKHVSFLMSSELFFIAI